MTLSKPRPQRLLSLIRPTPQESMRNTSKVIAESAAKILAKSIAEGISPRKAAARIATQMKSIAKKALSTARTEMLRAFNEGQLEGFESLGTDRVGAMV